MAACCSCARRVRAGLARRPMARQRPENRPAPRGHLRALIPSVSRCALRSLRRLWLPMSEEDLDALSSRLRAGADGIVTLEALADALCPGQLEAYCALCSRVEQPDPAPRAPRSPLGVVASGVVGGGRSDASAPPTSDPAVETPPRGHEARGFERGREARGFDVLAPQLYLHSRSPAVAPRSADPRRHQLYLPARYPAATPPATPRTWPVRAAMAGRISRSSPWPELAAVHPPVSYPPARLRDAAF